MPSRNHIPLHEDRPDSCEIAFAVAAREKHLQRRGGAEPHHEDRQAEHARNGRRTQLAGSRSARGPGRSVSVEPDELLHHQTQRRGEGYFQNLSIGRTHRRLNFGDTKSRNKAGSESKFRLHFTETEYPKRGQRIRNRRREPGFSSRSGATSVAATSYTGNAPPCRDRHVGTPM